MSVEDGVKLVISGGIVSPPDREAVASEDQDDAADVEIPPQAERK